MTVGPTSVEEATRAFQERREPLVTTLREALERAIRSEWIPGGHVILYPKQVWPWQVSTTERRAAFAAVAASYSAAGWELTWRSDQRDGDWIELKARG